MIFLERWEMNLAGKDILQFPIPDNDILPIIENLKLKPFVKAQSLAAMQVISFGDWFVQSRDSVTVCFTKRDAMMDCALFFFSSTISFLDTMTNLFSS